MRPRAEITYESYRAPLQITTLYITIITVIFYHCIMNQLFFCCTSGAEARSTGHLYAHDRVNWQIFGSQIRQKTPNLAA